MVAVDGGSTAKYGYDASNHRVRFDIWGGSFEELYNLTGQKVVIWNAESGSVVEEDTHLGTQPLAAYLGGALFFEHQDWLGTERLLTDGAGHTAGSYLSLPFGDGFTDQGTDLDPYHFAGMDHDYESGLDHAQFREYSSAGGRWLSPDPYSGSYDWSNPQSLNRYAYALNNPLSMSDPTGEDGCGDDFDWEDDDFGEGIIGAGDPGSDSGLASGIAADPHVPPEVVPCGTTYCIKTGVSEPYMSLQPLPSIVYPAVNASFSFSRGASGFSGPGLNTGTIAPSSMPSDAQYRCINGLFIKSAIAGVGSALGVQPPGSDPVGDVSGALKNAAKNPVIAMSAGAMAARMGGALLTRAGALALGEAVSTKFVPIVGGVATLYGIYSAVSDGIDYFNNNVAACHDAK